MARLRRTTFSLALALVPWLVPVSTRAVDNSPSALEQSPAGWTDLLARAGTNLEGWTRGPVPSKGKIPPLSDFSQWSLDPKTGHLVCTGDGGHDWLRWDQELGDFVYHVEWRFTPAPEKKGKYNSGVYARNSAGNRSVPYWHGKWLGLRR